MLRLGLEQNDMRKHLIKENNAMMKVDALCFNQNMSFSNCHLYHYANNNPVAYTDPDGNDIRESSIKSKSIAAIGALRINAGIARDSKKNCAVFLKFEMGVGFGGDIYKLNDSMKTFSWASDNATMIEEYYDAIDNFNWTPRDTGKGNFSDLHNFFDIISYKHEDFRSWNGNLPSEAGVIVGAEGDKQGNTEITLGANAIAATYLTEETFYINLSTIKECLKKIFKEDSDE